VSNLVTSHEITNNFELYPLQNENLTPKEDELINKYRALNKNKQERLQAYLDGLSES